MGISKVLVLYSCLAKANQAVFKSYGIKRRKNTSREKYQILQSVTNIYRTFHRLLIFHFVLFKDMFDYSSTALYRLFSVL